MHKFQRLQCFIAITLIAACAMGQAATAAAPISWQEQHASDTARVLRSIEAAGDLEALMAYYASLRGALEAQVEESNPGAVVGLKPALDELFGKQALRERIGERFVGSLFEESQKSAVEQWISDPEMAAISRSLAGFQPVEGQQIASLAPSRRALLLRLVQSAQLSSRVSGQMRGAMEFRARVADALDPASTAMRDVQGVLGSARVDDARIIDAWVAPALEGVGDDEVERYIAFAGTKAGSGYFFSLGQAWELRIPRFADPLAELVEAKARKVAAAIPAQQFAETVRQARELLRTDSSADAGQARALLIGLLASAPRNSEVLTLLGSAELALRPSSRSNYDLLRGFPMPQEHVEADRYLSLAVEIDPQNAEALQLLGRSLFFQERDEEAAAMLDRAEAADPETPWIRHAQADLASVIGDDGNAIRLYRQVLDAPERDEERFGHAAAFSNAYGAFSHAGRLKEYEELGSRYLKAHPDAHHIRIRLAAQRLDSGVDPEEVIAMLARSGHADPRMSRVLHAQALALRAKQEASADGNLSLRAQASLQEAQDLLGSRAELVTQLCARRSTVSAGVLVAQIEPRSDAAIEEVFWCALRMNEVESAKAMAIAGADVSSPSPTASDTPLFVAVWGNFPEMFEMLLERGADPSIALPFRNRTVVDSIEEMDPAKARRFLDALENHRKRRPGA